MVKGTPSSCLRELVESGTTGPLPRLSGLEGEAELLLALRLSCRFQVQQSSPAERRHEPAHPTDGSTGSGQMMGGQGLPRGGLEATGVSSVDAEAAHCQGPARVSSKASRLLPRAPASQTS